MGIARLGSANVWLSCLFYQLSCPSLRPIAAKRILTVPNNTAACDVLLGGNCFGGNRGKATKSLIPTNAAFIANLSLGRKTVRPPVCVQCDMGIGTVDCKEMRLAKLRVLGSF
jgi:hypothetical protein